jgi:hypothetical protein
MLDRISSSNSAGLNWVLDDANGRHVLARTASIDDVGPLVLMGGSYTLTILGELSIGASQTGTYSFRIVDVSDDSASMAVGDTVSGAIDFGEQDSYTFSAPVGQKVTLSLGASSNSAGLNWSLEDSYGRTILARTASLATTGPFTLVGGSYTIRLVGEISSGASQTGTYTFTLQNSGIDTSFVPSGTVITLGQQVDSSISVGGEIDNYLLTVPAGEKVFFDLQVGASNLRWTLFDPVGREVFGPNATANQHQRNQGPFVLAAGSYVLRLTTTSGTGRTGSPPWACRTAPPCSHSAGRPPPRSRAPVRSTSTTSRWLPRPPSIST